MFMRCNILILLDLNFDFLCFCAFLRLYQDLNPHFSPLLRNRIVIQTTIAFAIGVKC